MNIPSIHQCLIGFYWLRQELKVSQCLSVRPSVTKFSRAVNLNLSRSGINQRAIIALRELREQSESTKRVLRERLESTQRLFREQSGVRALK